jgi:hypothetical protein
MMPAISFQPEFIDALLLSTKQQTTRQFTSRFHVGDTGHIYIQQRMPITEKPLRRLTSVGIDVMHERGYPEFHHAIYHAHFLGTVEIAHVIDIHPCNMDDEYLEGWAVDDGFADFCAADAWFSSTYNENWMDDWWTVVLWEGWTARYFEAGAIGDVS